jgi:hypothetical protein
MNKGSKSYLKYIRYIGNIVNNWITFVNEYISTKNKHLYFCGTITLRRERCCYDLGSVAFIGWPRVHLDMTSNRAMSDIYVFIYESYSGYDLYSGSVRCEGGNVKMTSGRFSETHGFLWNI